jgi:hypothetical protein
VRRVLSGSAVGDANEDRNVTDDEEFGFCAGSHPAPGEQAFEENE